MQKIYLIYIIMAIFLTCSVKCADFLIKEGFAHDDIMFWIVVFLVLGIGFGRLSVIMEHKYYEKNNKKAGKRRGY